jgi:beta-lactamase regulating signal transducer with metallopeptidase domain
MTMELLLVLFTVLGWAIAGSAAAELLAAMFSARVRRYMAQHPVAHVVWFACALCLARIVIPAYRSTRAGGF